MGDVGLNRLKATLKKPIFHFSSFTSCIEQLVRKL